MSFSHEEIGKILDEIPPEVAWRRPDSVIRDTADLFQIITPTSKLISLNGVYRTHASRENVDAVIEETIRDFGKYQNSFRWIVTGATRPADLGDLLTKHKFKFDHEALGLAADPSSILKARSNDIQVVDLMEDDLDEWVDAAIAGWGHPETFRESINLDIRRILREKREPLRYFSAIDGSQIVGTGTLRICEKSAHLLGSCVRPEFRGRGVYQALVRKRAEVALVHDLDLVTTHGMVNTSAPILRKMGFSHYDTSTQFSYTFPTDHRSSLSSIALS